MDFSAKYSARKCLEKAKKPVIKIRSNLTQWMREKHTNACQFHRLVFNSISCKEWTSINVLQTRRKIAHFKAQEQTNIIFLGSFYGVQALNCWNLLKEARFLLDLPKSLPC